MKKSKRMSFLKSLTISQHDQAAGWVTFFGITYDEIVIWIFIVIWRW